MDKNLYFFRYDKDGTYHRFGIFHYISMKSFIVNNPNTNVILFSNRTPLGIWYDLLINQYLNKNLFIEKYPENPETDKFVKTAHKVDVDKLKLLYEIGGGILDSDFICIHNIEKFFETEKLMLLEELSPLTHDFYSLAIGALFCKKSNKIVLNWYNAYKSAKSDIDWTEMSGKYVTELYNKFPDEFEILPQQLVNPFSYDHDSLADLFLHDHKFTNSLMFHCSESLAWSRYLKRMTLEHIMTVNTTFTRIVRRYVKEFWDEESHRPLIRVK